MATRTHAPLFPVTHWAAREDTLIPGQMTLAETIFSLANGYVGTRGTFEEGVEGNPSSIEGTYLNGLFLRQEIHYEESAYGYATHNHKMLQIPDGKEIRISIDGEAYDPYIEHCVSHTRTLDFRTGISERRTRWQLPDKREIEVCAQRLLSFANPHAMAIRFEVTPLNFTGTIRLESALNAAYGQHLNKYEEDPRAGHLLITDHLDLMEAQHTPEQLTFLHWIRGSDHLVGSACRHRCELAQPENDRVNQDYNAMSVRFEALLQEGETLRLDKYVAYHDAHTNEQDALKSQLCDTLEHCCWSGFNGLAQQQEGALAEFWKYADVAIDGADALQQGIRFNLFQIFQSTGKDGRRAIGAKGLSGPGYDGHYFWDTEIYIIPFYVFTQPAIARALLCYRYALLDQSRHRARLMGHDKGAQYAWRTIGGEECSSFFPAGSAQYHINAAIAYAILQYFEATEDWQFMTEYGAEMLMETARIWADLGHFSDVKGGQFCMNEVTGPDEYSAMVDNNFYTNAMARMHLRGAAQIASQMKEKHSTEYTSIAARIDLQDSEIELWQRAAEAMYLPFDEALQIHPQDDGFLGKPRWDFEHTPPEKYPLLLHFHPLKIYRHQVLKQADVVLAMALLGHEFPDQVRCNNLDYYTPITTHDSTLSTCIYSIESSRCGKPKEAYGLFEQTARMDLDNLHHNTEYGLHTACMAGSWMNIAFGFAGLEVYDKALHFAPHLPEEWQGYRLSLRFRRRRIGISIGDGSASFELHDGEKITIYCYQQAIELKAGKPAHISLQGWKETA